MELQAFLDHVDSGAPIEAGSSVHSFMNHAAQDALRITAELNGAYRAPEEIRRPLTRLTGKPVEESVTVFPPF